MLLWPSRKGHNHVPHDVHWWILSPVTTVKPQWKVRLWRKHTLDVTTLWIRQAFCISMLPPPDGVNAQSRWPCGKASRTQSLLVRFRNFPKIKRIDRLANDYAGYWLVLQHNIWNGSQKSCNLCLLKILLKTSFWNVKFKWLPASSMAHWGWVTHICLNKLSLVQIMACHLVGAEVLSEPMLEYW